MREAERNDLTSAGFGKSPFYIPVWFRPCSTITMFCSSWNQRLHGVRWVRWVGAVCTRETQVVVCLLPLSLLLIPCPYSSTRKRGTHSHVPTYLPKHANCPKTTNLKAISLSLKCAQAPALSYLPTYTLSLSLLPTYT